jgi:hypothetical protein
MVGCVVTAAAALFMLTSLPTDAVAAKRNDAYAQRKAECKDRASKMNFGIHLIKKNRWVKNCIAGGHRA